MPFGPRRNDGVRLSLLSGAKDPKRGLQELKRRRKHLTFTPKYAEYITGRIMASQVIHGTSIPHALPSQSRGHGQRAPCRGSAGRTGHLLRCLWSDLHLRCARRRFAAVRSGDAHEPGAGLGHAESDGHGPGPTSKSGTRVSQAVSRRWREGAGRQASWTARPDQVQRQCAHPCADLPQRGHILS